MPIPAIKQQSPIVAPQMSSTPAQNPRLCSFHSLGPNGFHEIAYTEWGNPYNHRMVFCVHGFTRNSRDFDALAASLAETCHVVCMDAAGRGASEWLTHKGDYNFSLYLSDAAALLARVTAPLPPPSRIRRFFGRAPAQPKHIDWVGTSMGGLIGMMLAAKRGSPIRRLVLNDVGPLVPWPALMRMKQSQKGLKAKFSSFEDVETHLRETSAEFGPLSDEQWRHVAHHSAIRKGDGSLVLAYDPAIISHMRTGSVPGVAFGSEFLSGIDLWPTYDMIRCPTLALRGALSDVLLKKTADEMTRRGPKATVVEFEGVGHAPWLMADDQIGVIRDFLLEGASEAPLIEETALSALFAPSY
jgi:pimeloyl-ACP methyl ester carboxylesterase